MSSLIIITLSGSCVSQTGEGYHCSRIFSFAADVDYLPYYAQRAFTIPFSLPIWLVNAGVSMLFCLLAIGIIPFRSPYLPKAEFQIWCMGISFFLGMDEHELYLLILLNIPPIQEGYLG